MVHIAIVMFNGCTGCGDDGSGGDNALYFYHDDRPIVAVDFKWMH